MTISVGLKPRDWPLRGCEVLGNRALRGSTSNPFRPAAVNSNNTSQLVIEVREELLPYEISNVDILVEMKVVPCQKG